MTQTLGSGMTLSLNETNQLKINQTIKQLMQGRSNAVNTFTLTSSSTSTTVTSPTIGPNSILLWMPTTPDAASQMATLFCVSVGISTSVSGSGQAVLNHANNANNDQTFNYLSIG